MKNSKIIIGGLCICVLIAFGIIGYKLIDGGQAKKEPVVSYMQASYSINIDSKEEVVGAADYVFVAKVLNKVRTEYRNPVTRETEDGGTKTVSFPFTIYSIEVIDNIKGKLKKNIAFDITKRGGITEDGDTLLIFENDQLPEENKYYIMMGYAQSDGSLMLSGANSNILINATDKQDINSSEEYKEYKTAAKNAIESNRERSKSSYEE